MSSEYVEFTSDFGFKRLMSDKKVLLQFLNSVLDDAIEDIILLEEVKQSASAPTSPTEETELEKTRSRSASAAEQRTNAVFLSEQGPGELSTDKSIIYDLVCVTDKEEFINIEMQKAKQEYFLHRGLYYAARLIGRQGWKGGDSITSYFAHHSKAEKKRLDKKWEWELKKTYHIGIIDFSIASLKDVPEKYQDSWMVWSQLAFNKDRSRGLPADVQYGKEDFNDLLNIVKVSLRDFEEPVDSLNNDLSKFVWLFKFFGSLGRTIQLPAWCADDKFKNLLELMKVASLSLEDKMKYEYEMKAIINLNADRQSAIREGKAIGKMEEKVRMIRLLYDDGLESTNSKEEALKKCLKFFTDDTDLVKTTLGIE